MSVALRLRQDLISLFGVACREVADRSSPLQVSVFLSSLLKDREYRLEADLLYFVVGWISERFLVGTHCACESDGHDG